MSIGLFPTVEITSLTITDDLIVMLGCRDCSSSKGIIEMYDRDTMQLQYESPDDVDVLKD